MTTWFYNGKVNDKFKVYNLKQYLQKKSNFCKLLLSNIYVNYDMF